MKIVFGVLERSIVREVSEDDLRRLLLGAAQSVMGATEKATAATMEGWSDVMEGKTVEFGVFSVRRLTS